MESLISNIFLDVSGAWSYAIVLFVLLLCGLGIPLPEDVVLIFGGFQVFSQGIRLDLMLVIAFLGILGGDSIAFWLGRHLGNGLTRRWPFRFVFTPSKREKAEKLFDRYGDRIIIAARFMPGARAVTYFFAGTLGMNYLRFVAFDGLAAMVSAPLFVYLGYHFGDQIHWLISAVRQGQGVALLVAMLGAGIFLVTKYVRKRLSTKMPELPLSHHSTRRITLSNELSTGVANDSTEEENDAVKSSNKSRRFSARPPA